MNKKIYKGYELFKMIANKELNENCKIKDTITEHTAIWDGMNFRIEDNDGRYFTETFDDIKFAIREFELLEDNTEEIEELNVTKEEIDSYDDIDLIIQDRLRINKLVRAVKKLQKESEDKQ